MTDSSRVATSGPLSACCLLLAIASLAGCNRGLPQHDGASFAVSADGKVVAWTTGSGSNNILRVQREGKISDVAKGTYHEGPTFSPDARTVVVAIGPNFRSRLEIVEFDIASGKKSVLISADDRSNSMPSLSPDGKKLAFIRAAKPRSQSMGGVQWQDFDLYVANADGTDASAITTSKFVRATTPRWSPDGSRIVFSALDREGLWQILEFDSESKKPLRKITGKNNESMPVFVGDRMAIVSDRESPGKYTVGYLDSGGKLEPLLQAPGYYLDLQAASDTIYALEDVTHKMRFRISAIDAKTGAIREVVPEASFDEVPQKR